MATAIFRFVFLFEIKISVKQTRRNILIDGCGLQCVYVYFVKINSSSTKLVSLSKERPSTDYPCTLHVHVMYLHVHVMYIHVDYRAATDSSLWYLDICISLTNIRISACFQRNVVITRF